MLSNVNSGNRIGQPSATDTSSTPAEQPAPSTGEARQSSTNHALSGLTPANERSSAPQITARSGGDTAGGSSTATTSPPPIPARSPLRPPPPPRASTSGTSGTSTSSTPSMPTRPQPAHTTAHSPLAPPPRNPARLLANRPPPRSPRRLHASGSQHRDGTAALHGSHDGNDIELDALPPPLQIPHPLQLAETSTPPTPPLGQQSHEQLASMALTGRMMVMPTIQEQDERIADTQLQIAQIDVPPPSDAEMQAVGELVDQLPTPDLHDPQQRAMHEAVTQFLTDLVSRIAHQQIGGVSLSDVASNNFDNTYAKGLASIANSVVARAASVYVPTLGRQLAGQRFAEGMNHQNWSNEARTAFGTAVTFVPIALLLAGAARDAKNGVATNTSQISRYALAAIGGTMMIAGLGTGAMAGAAASLGAYVLYCAMRDSVQTVVKLGAKEPKQPAPIQSFATGSAYSVDQMATGSGMSYTATPSGAGAAGEPLQSGHGAERAGYNMGGEVMDDMVSAAITQRGMPQLTLGAQIPSMKDLADTVTGAFPGRATLFTASTLLSQMVAEHMTSASPSTQTNINNLSVALMLGLLLYTPFAQMGNTKAATPAEPRIAEVPDDPTARV